MKNEIYRHGDMIIFRVDSLVGKNKTVKGKKLVVGLGEVTGHSHDVIALDGTDIVAMYDGEVNVTEEDLAEMDSLYFQISGNGAVIVHEEHKPILLREGMYLRINQVEYNPFTEEMEKVRD